MRSPPITISSTDYNELVFALGFVRDGERAQFLAQELRRATLCHPDSLPDDVVALNGRVIFRISDESRCARLLVHPYNLLCPTAEISVLSAVGTALLGMRVCDTMRFAEGGLQREVTVEGVGMRFAGTGAPRFKRADAPNPPVLDALSARELAHRPDTRSACHA